MKVLGMFGRTAPEALADPDAPLDASATQLEESIPDDAQAPSEFHEVLDQLREQWGRLGLELRQQQDECITGLIQLCERLEQRGREKNQALEMLQQEADGLRDERERLVAEAAQLRGEREQLSAAAARAKQDQDELAAEAVQLRDERDQLASAAAQSLEGYEERDSEIAQLRRERSEFAAEAARLRKERAQLAGEVAQLADERDLFAAELKEREHATATPPESGPGRLEPPGQLEPVREPQQQPDRTTNEPVPSATPDAFSSRDEPAEVSETSEAEAAPPSLGEPIDAPDCIDAVRTTVIRDNDQMQVGIKAKLHEVSCSAVSLLLPRALKVEEYVVIEMENERERIEVRVRAYVRHIEPVVGGWHLVSFAPVNQLEFKDVQSLKVS